MQQPETAKQVVEMMLSNDRFSQWLGIERMVVEPGRCILKMKVRAEMLNGFGIAHGAISYAIADSALAFASNSHGRRSVSIETSISHTAPLREHDEILAEAVQRSLTEKIGIYQVDITRNGESVALFKGTVYRTSKNWIE